MDFYLSPSLFPPFQITWSVLQNFNKNTLFIYKFSKFFLFSTLKMTDKCNKYIQGVLYLVCFQETFVIFLFQAIVLMWVLYFLSESCQLYDNYIHKIVWRNRIDRVAYGFSATAAEGAENHWSEWAGLNLIQMLFFFSAPVVFGN